MTLAYVRFSKRKKCNTRGKKIESGEGREEQRWDLREEKVKEDSKGR